MQGSSHQGFPRRWHYGLLALLYAAALFYAAALPLQFDPMPLREAWAQLGAMKWADPLAMGRSDLLNWMAHLVAGLPLGFLIAGAVLADAQRRPAAVALLAAVAGLSMLVPIAIEFAQLFVPQRTSSWADAVAGMMGQGAGVVLWFAIGQALTGTLRSAAMPGGAAKARRGLLMGYLAALIAWRLLPPDVMTTAAAFFQKIEAGRFNLVPLEGLWEGDVEALMGYLRLLAMYVPVALLFHLGWLWPGCHGRRGSPGRTILGAALVAAVIETLRIPLFHATVDATAVVMAVLAAWLVHLGAGRVVDRDGAITLGRGAAPGFGRAAGLVIVAVHGGVMAALLWRPWQVDLNPGYWLPRLERMWNWPFVNHFWSGEWQSLVKVSLLMAAFVPAGLVLRWAWGGGRSGCAASRRGWALLAAGWSAAVGLVIELGQVFIRGHTPHSPFADITDVLCYSAGALVGWWLGGVLLAPNVPRGAHPDLSPPGGCCR